MKMQDDFGFEPHALFETIRNWATGQVHNEDSAPEVEVIEPGALGNANGPSGASDYTVLRARLEAGSVSITDTVEDGQYRRQRIWQPSSRLAVPGAGSFHSGRSASGQVRFRALRRALF